MIRLVVLLVLALAVARMVRTLLPPRSGGTADRWDPHAILGVARGASAKEIAQAYREQLKRYHPDRVADLGPELQRVAHRKTLDIRRAYDELSRR